MAADFFPTDPTRRARPSKPLWVHRSDAARLYLFAAVAGFFAGALISSAVWSAVMFW